MKKLLLILCLFPLLLSAEKFKIETIFRPAVVTAGEPIELTLISNKRGNLTFDLPEISGARWLKNYVSSSTQTSIVNGVVSVSVRRTIPIMTEKPGVLTIPSFSVRCGKETAVTRELVIKVLSSSDRPESAVSGIPDPSGSITLPAGNRTFYAGEEIQLDLSLLIPAGLEVRELTYPELSGLGSAVLTDFSKVNPRNRFFAPPVDRRRIIGNNEYTEVLFRTSFRALKAERLIPEAVASLGIVYRTQSRTPRSMFDDDFFDGFFSNRSSRVVPRQVKFKFSGKEIDILPLPPLEGNAKYLNLVGRWKVSVKLGSTTARVGEPVELEVTLSGSGSAETLEPPQLQIPGFRIYPPEIKRYPDRIAVKYALIPLETGEKLLTPAFAIFDPVKKGYVITRSKLTLPVSPGNAVQPVRVSAVPEKETGKRILPAQEKPAPPPVRRELFYQKKSPGKSVKLPLIRNQLIWCISLLAGAFVLGGWLKIRGIRKAKEQSDSSFRRKNELHHQLKGVIAELKEYNYSSSKVREKAVPFLAESMGMSPGSTPEELAERISDPLLADWLRALNSSGFIPGSNVRDAEATAARIKSLLKALKRCGIWLVLIGTFSLQAGFNSTFNAGKYAEAEAEYRKYISSGQWAPGALYNLGAVYYMQNDLPKARLYFMRALLLAPRDAETLENLNLVNRKLMQNETGSTATPAELAVWCRDRLRPDQYILLAVLCGAVLIVLAGAWNRRKTSLWYWCAGISGVLMLIFILSAVFQMSGPYSSRNALVIVKTLKIRSLPVESGKVEAGIAGGGTAYIVEKRGQWCRIRINGRDGWVKAGDIEVIFPEGLW